MRSTLKLIFILWIGQTFAQSYMYIKPIINLKSNISSTSQNSIISNTFPQNPYLLSKNRLLTPLKNVNFGLAVGYYSKALNSSVELSYRTDECATHINEHFFSYSNLDEQFYEQNLYFNYSLLLHNFRVDGFKYYNNGFFLGLGVGVLKSSVKNSTNVNTIDNFSLMSIDLDSINTIKIDRSVIASNRSSVNVQLTFGRKIEIKNFYLLDISICLTKSFRYIMYTQHTYTVTENNQLKVYNIANFGSGSGIYFNISRRLQFYPWKKRMKRGDDEVK